MICTKCFQAQYPNSAGKCGCGGNLERLSDWKWVDDGKPETG